jgi:light-regulated signal transduction histidine kinase (bacteriophytochrome)
LQIASEEMASFTYITSNKIKEPIRHIYTGVEFLIKSEAARLSDSGKASFRRIQSSLNRMDLLLDDILKLSQISILQKSETSVDLTELVTQVVEEIKQKTDQHVKFVIDELCVIPGHIEYLHLLFYHLLDNAIKFNHADFPEIKISCQKVEVNEGNDDLLHLNEFYKLTITDNGIGFKQEDEKRIFSMFEKLHDRQYKGSGTGLAIAQKIMHAHDGFIKAESNGHGALFHCFFPA